MTMSILQHRRSSWVSQWHALFHTAKDGDIVSTPQDFQQSGPAKTSKAGVKSSLLEFLRNPIKCKSKSWQPRTAPPLFQFERLPPELILEITKYLSLSSALSLGYTCRTFRQTVEARVEDLDYLIDMQSFLRGLKESEGERKLVLERLAFLCMLERDGQLSASKAVCSGCKTTHQKSLFSSTALQQMPRRRVCLGREGRLWICPHRIWDYAQLREVQKQGYRPVGSMAQCGCPNGEVSVHYPSNDFPATEIYSLSIYYSVLAMPRGSELHIASIRKALSALGVNVCPHLKFGDPKMLGAFHPGCPRLEESRFWAKCVQCASRGPQSVCGIDVHCTFCKTKITFYRSELSNETTTLWAQVYRRIVNSAKTLTDPTWIAYLYMPADFERLHEEWQASSMGRFPQDRTNVGRGLGQRWGKAFAGRCITRC